MFCGVCAVDHNSFGRHLPINRGFGLIEAWWDGQDSVVRTLLVFEKVRDELGLAAQLGEILRRAEHTSKHLERGGYLVRAVGSRSGFSSEAKASDRDGTPSVSDLYQAAIARVDERLFDLETSWRPSA